MLGLLGIFGCEHFAPLVRQSSIPVCATALGGAKRFSLHLQAEGARVVEFVVFHPPARGRYPLIAFSSGAFSDPDRYRKILDPIAASGTIIIAPVPVDAEKLRPVTAPAQHEIWNTRLADMRLALDPPPQLLLALENRDLRHAGGRAAMGHSFGALIAQIAGGAQVRGPDGGESAWTGDRADAVIAWSPPGEMADRAGAWSFESLAVPHMTLTGTTDVLPGFIDDWRAHRFAFDHSPRGERTLWVGRKIDHYFNGAFGRERATDRKSAEQLKIALADVIGFLSEHVRGSRRCKPPADSVLRTVERDV